MLFGAERIENSVWGKLSLRCFRDIQVEVTLKATGYARQELRRQVGAVTVGAVGIVRLSGEGEWLEKRVPQGAARIPSLRPRLPRT